MKGILCGLSMVANSVCSQTVALERDGIGRDRTSADLKNERTGFYQMRSGAPMLNMDALSLLLVHKNELVVCGLHFILDKEDCIVTFYKLYQNSGFSENLPFTCSITYEDFKSGFYLCVFDLSTSSKCNSAGLTPAIRTGHLRLKVTFSEALPLDLTACLHAEFPSTIFLPKDVFESIIFELSLPFIFLTLQLFLNISIAAFLY